MTSARARALHTHFVGPQDAIKYLMWVIRDNGNKDAAIHNYMLSLLAKSREDSGRLLDFIESQCADGQAPVFDLKYALRVCAREGRNRCATVRLPCVCVRACVRACVHACVRACVCMCRPI